MIEERESKEKENLLEKRDERKRERELVREER